MKRTLKIIAVILMISAVSASKIYAEDNIPEGGKTINEIINIMYDGEDETVKQMALDAALVATKQKPAEPFQQQYTRIGSYQSDDIIRKTLKTNLCGAYAYAVSFCGNGQTSVYYKTDQIDDQTAERSALRLQILYNTITDLRLATQGMDDLTKCKYIHDYVCDAITYILSPVDSAGMALDTGCGDCGSYAALFYILGRGCGLNVSIDTGANIHNNASHAWNTIQINGVEYIVDVTNDDSTHSYNYYMISREEFYTLGYDERRYQ